MLHAYADLDWATCVKTRRSFGATCIQLAGGTIAYKCKFQPTVAGFSTEAKFMAAYDTGKMTLFVCSILWDLNIPQEAATVLYEDNDACTAMGNAQKPTTHTRHIDIKYFFICEWIERDLMLLERIDTSINMSDHLTKGALTSVISLSCGFSLRSCPSCILTSLQIYCGNIHGQSSPSRPHNSGILYYTYYSCGCMGTRPNQRRLCGQPLVTYYIAW